MKNLPVFLDMDCVLSDFVGGVARLHGTTRDELERLQPPGEYDYGKALGRHAITFVTGTFSGDPTFTKEQFWKPINDTPGFWLGLDPLPWADELFWVCHEAAGGKWWKNRGTVEDPEWYIPDWGNLYVVTSPSRCPGCIREKEDWLMKHFGLPHDRMIPTPQKHLMAVTKDGPAVLVDDYDLNCDRFRAAGGDAILLPARHNSDHRFVGSELEVVRRRLDRIRTR